LGEKSFEGIIKKTKKGQQKSEGGAVGASPDAKLVGAKDTTAQQETKREKKCRVFQKKGRIEKLLTNRKKKKGVGS